MLRQLLVILVFLSYTQSAFALSHLSSEDRKIIDLIVEGEHVVSMEDTKEILREGAVAVDKGVIIALGKADDLKERYRAKIVLGGKNRIVMPGLINGHSHAAMTLFRGIADDHSLFEWLNRYIFPAEVEYVNREFVQVGTELACWEMIRGGTTTFVDMYYFPDVIAEVVESCGLRALISATVIDQPSPDARNAKDSLKKGKSFVTKWKDRNSRIIPILGPHSNYTLDLKQLIDTRRLANQLGIGLSIHLAESKYENQYARDNYKNTSVNIFESIGFFEGRTIAAHVVWPSDEEIEILAKRAVGAIYNPTSNMKTAAGIAPISKMIEAGIKVGLGTDGAASNNDLDMWEEMRLATLLQKINKMDPEALPASKVISMATREGSEAIGISSIVGTLEVGKRADLIQVSTEDVHHIPTYDVISHLVYVTDEQDVESVIVDGKILMKDKNILTINTEKVRKRASEIASSINQSLKGRR
ncbi:MAG: 5-methylthioadenosine deaminase [Gammaproteobacteria bacterium]|nr:5-methylthioadenosine deaminase [Gammaproteobacteria bacterium]